jgi:FkbM family methyltransferase
MLSTSVMNFVKRLVSYLISKNTSKNDDAIRIWKKSFNRSGKFIFKLEDSLSIFLYKDSYLSKLISEGFEKDEISFVTKFLKTEDSFMDIGANIGYFSIYAANAIGPSGTVYCFEPTPKVYNRLVSNLKLNGFKNYKAFNFAVSDENKSMYFHISKSEYDAWNSFVFSHKSKSKPIEVKAVKIDSLVDKGSIVLNTIALVKIDVEGWELPVLKGMTKLLELKHAPVFLVEFTEKNAQISGFSLRQIYDYMINYGFVWYRYDSTENVLRHEPFSDNYPYDNLIATKNFNYVNERLKVI